MDGVEKESASEITNPPGSGPCSPARPGLVPRCPIVNLERGEVVIHQEIYKEWQWELRMEGVVFVVRLKKEESHE